MLAVGKLTSHSRGFTMPDIKQQIDTLTSTFVDGLLQALRSSSVDELFSLSGETSSRKARAVTSSKPAKAVKAAKVAKPGRLVRRSPEDIAKVVDQMSTLLAKHPDGLRSEQIRELLKLESKEMPRPLGEALASGLLVAKGQKRATVYRLKGAKAAKAVKPAAKSVKAGKAGKAVKTVKTKSVAKSGKTVKAVKAVKPAAKAVKPAKPAAKTAKAVKPVPAAPSAES